MLTMGVATDHDGRLEGAPPAARPWSPFLCIIAASALAHLWCLGSQFYMDDPPAIRDNEAIHNGMFWNTLTLSWTNLFYVLQYKLFGASAAGFHAVNWLLHTSVACVLFGFGRDFLRGRGDAGVALVGALLFAVHPLASEIPNYARTQDLAWVTLFSLLASWSLLRYLQDGGWCRLVWMVACIAGATLSKGPGLFHALMMTGAVGLAFMTPAHRDMLRQRIWWVAGAVLTGVAALWISGVIPRLLAATSLWAEPRFIGHGYTVARVFWEFAWRSVIPVSLSADHQIAETLMPPDAKFWNIPDTVAMWAAAGMLALTAFSLLLAWRKTTRLVGVCLFLFVATMLFRVAYLIPEFMPEYRIYPGLPWFCLGAAILLGSGWHRLLGDVSPRVPVILLVSVFAVMSAKRSFLWHDLDRLEADVLRQYPAHGRAVWELNERDAFVGDWRKIVERQRHVWPKVFAKFLAENQRLAPKRELPSGHFALALVASTGIYAQALAHVEGPAAGMAELRRLEILMRQLKLDPVAKKDEWNYFYKSKALVFEQAGNPQAALELMRRDGMNLFKRSDFKRLEGKLKPTF
jgi:hypothetical protein